mmetsp:Transcript_16679/g.14590  ORF Transcript_16679/g.14590 Transcript_16679/m.14590 type:complete len:146 (+) Transcript_16679:369-806(+)
MELMYGGNMKQYLIFEEFILQSPDHLNLQYLNLFDEYSEINVTDNGDVKYIPVLNLTNHSANFMNQEYIIGNIRNIYDSELLDSVMNSKLRIKKVAIFFSEEMMESDKRFNASLKESLEHIKLNMKHMNENSIPRDKLYPFLNSL